MTFENRPIRLATTVSTTAGVRTTLRGLALLVLLVVTTACSGGSPTSPSSVGEAGGASSIASSTGSRVINVVGNLSFGEVPVGSQRSMSYTITNAGNSTLTVTGTTISGGLAAHTLFSWTSGQIAPGASQTVTVRFQPTAAGSFNGTVSVNGDQTAGSNVVAISGTSAGASVAGTWSGRYIVERCDGTGSNQDYFCSAQRGAYPPGSSLPVSVTLTQSGSAVNGTIRFGSVTGPVNGVVNANGSLVLQGSASAGQVSLSLSSWNAVVAGLTLSGNFAYNASLSGIPGVAVVVSRFSGVTRQ